MVISIVIGRKGKRLSVVGEPTLSTEEARKAHKRASGDFEEVILIDSRSGKIRARKVKNEEAPHEAQGPRKKAK